VFAEKVEHRSLAPGLRATVAAQKREHRSLTVAAQKREHRSLTVAAQKRVAAQKQSLRTEREAA
jgi:hypothetical protein